jgi:hypothetical protein
MKQTFRKVEEQLDFTSRKGFLRLLLLIITFKLLLLVVKVLFIKHGLPNEFHGFWGLWAGDTSGYIDPFEKLHSEGVYTDGYRMPLYGFLYFLFRLILTRIMALNVLILFQIFVTSLAVIYTGKIVYAVTKSKAFGLITILVTCLAFQTALYDWILLPQALVSAFLIFFAYHSICYFKKLSDRNLWFALLFSFLILFLYPVFVCILFFLFAAGLYTNRQQKLLYVKKLLIVSLPLIALEGLWMYRNYVVFSIPHPLAATYNAFGAKEDNEFKHELFQFGMATGVDICAWQPNSELRYFQHMKVPLATGGDGFDSTASFPVQLLKGTPITTDSLLDLKRKIADVRESHDSLKTDIVEAELNRFTGYIKNEKPFHYWIGSRIRILTLFFNYRGNDSIFFREGNNSAFSRLLKPYVQLLYSVFFFISLLFPLSMFANHKSVAHWFLVGMYLYVIFIFPVVFKVIEHRYFSSGFPFIVLAAILTVYNFSAWRKKKSAHKSVLPQQKIYA